MLRNIQDKSEPDCRLNIRIIYSTVFFKGACWLKKFLKRHTGLQWFKIFRLTDACHIRSFLKRILAKRQVKSNQRLTERRLYRVTQKVSHYHDSSLNRIKTRH